MKKILLVAACMVGAIGVLAQGTVNLNNYTVNAPVLLEDGSPAGTDFQVQLWAGADEASLAPVGDVAQGNIVGQGFYLIGKTDTGLPGGSAGVVAISVWNSAAANYEAAVALGEGLGGVSNLISIAAFGDDAAVPPATPADLVGLESLTVSALGGGPVIPEPSTIALGLLGAAVLLLRRRK